MSPLAKPESLPGSTQVLSSLLPTATPLFKKNGLTFPLCCSPSPLPPFYSHRPPREVEVVIVYFSQLFPICPNLFGVGPGGMGE